MNRYWDAVWQIYPNIPARKAPKDFKERFRQWAAVRYMRSGPEFPIDPDTAAYFLKGRAERASVPAGEYPDTVHCIGQLSAGGAERQLVNLLINLAERGHDRQSLLFVNPLEGSNAHYVHLIEDHNIGIRVNNRPVREEGIELIRSNPEIVEMIMRMPMSFNAWVLDLWVDLKLMQPQVAHFWLDHCNLWGGCAAVLADVPAIVLSTRNVHPMNFPYMSAPYMLDWYRYLQKCPRVRMLNNSAPGAASYAEWMGISEKKIDVVLNGVTLSHLQPATPAEREQIRSSLGVPLDARVVVGAFRMSDEKRPLLWVETFAKAKQRVPGLHAVLMGEGPASEAVDAKARELAVADSFHHIGRRNDLPKVMTSMDVFLHTAWWEGTPNVVLEAQQLRLPVVVTDAGGSVHSVAEGRTGHLVPKEDTEALASALIDVLTHLDSWKERAAAGPDFIRERFSVDRMVDETLGVQYKAMGFLTKTVATDRE